MDGERKPLSVVHNMDCMEFMKGVPSKHYDLAVADPPYGIGIASNPVRQRQEKKYWDNAIPKDDFFNELFRVSKNQIIWGGNYFYLPPTKGFVVWDKKQPENFTLAMCEFAWTSFDIPAKMFRQHVASNGETKIHPTQKSVLLYRWLLEHYAKTGDKIFDPMAGSQSSRIAAYQLGFDYEGCEIDETYFADGNNRFDKECLGIYHCKDGRTIRQLMLFDD